MLVITLGDPFSINQRCLSQLDTLWARPLPGPVVCVGAYEQWQRQCARFGLRNYAWTTISSWEGVRGPGLYFLAIDGAERRVEADALSSLERGQIATRSLLALETAPLPATPRSLAVLTAPIDKQACAQAGFAFPGQTEFFAKLWGAPGIMILAGPRLRVALATNHLALSAVAQAIDGRLLIQKLTTLDASLKEIFGIAAPRLGVAALNPHAGDGGLFGDEDQRILAPAIAAARSLGLDARGPFPADTLFFQAYEGHFDAVLAMYHDQGLGPLKTVHFYDAVNVTGGLPALRLSPDHGPAANLFGRQEARADSFRLALEHALSYLGW